LLLTPSVSSSAQSLELSVITRFTDLVIQPDEKLFVKQLSQTADVLLVYVRVLSARRNTHQYKTVSAIDALDHEKVIRLLSQRGDVVYAEKDLKYNVDNSLESSQ